MRGCCWRAFNSGDAIIAETANSSPHRAFIVNAIIVSRLRKALRNQIICGILQILHFDGNDEVYIESPIHRHQPHCFI